MQLLTFFAIFIAAGSVLFALQNTVPVTITFLAWHFDSSLALVLLGTLALGFLILALVSTPATVRRQWALSRLNKRIAELEQLNAVQTQTIAELEKRLPTAEFPPQEERPYEGLKQIISGSGTSDS